ncbi:MAG TPA: MotA/TolQ/ExbB proton channel family protein [bacterium]|nr:MotA/TolQ/ExbB proton channel family protein [bacterium]
MATTLFLILGIGSLIVAFVLEGGHLGGLVEPTAAMIVFGGTFGALGVSFPVKDFKRLFGVARVAFGETRKKLIEQIFFFIDISSLARKEGILALERIINSEESLDQMTRTGLQLVADGVEHDLIRDILELYIEKMEERHKVGFGMFEAAGGFAPTMGIIGTVMGLVHVLSSLADAASLGPKIAVAFIATLYGVASANLVWLPIASKLKQLNAMELNEKQIVIEAILLVEKGVSPKIVEEKLKAFLDKDDLERFEYFGKPKGEEK